MMIEIIPNSDIKDTARAAEILGEKLLAAGIGFSIGEIDGNRDGGGRGSGITKDGSANGGIPKDGTANGGSAGGRRPDGKRPDMVISIGGDGTYLHTVRYAVNYGIPVLGMNMGNLGFLTQFDLSGIDSAVELIKNGKYSVENRMIEDVKIYRGGKIIYRDFAVNDFVIHRDSIKMLDLEIYADNSYVTSFYGDGLIIATPTGSTAYSLSAGGPIIEPESHVMLLTPVCPHSTASRPMVISDKRNVRICIKEKKGSEATIAADGRNIFQITVKDEILIKKSGKKAKTVKLYQTDFYKILREKFL